MQSLTSNDHLVNFSLLGLVKQAGLKQAFVPGGDPGMGGGGGGAPPGGGGDPAAGGGAPPPGGDPAAGGGGGGDPMATLQPMIQQMVQQQMAQAGGGAGAGGQAGGAGAPLKPKIDVNVEIMQIKNMLAKICDHLKIHIPAQDMTATPEKLMAMSQGQSTASPDAGGGAPPGGGGAIGGIGAMDPMQGAGTPGGEKMGGYKGNGVSFDTASFAETANKAQAVMRLRNKQG